MDQFQQFADLLPGGAVLLTAEGKILAASAATKQCWQLSPEELIGRPMASLMSSSAEEFATFLRVCGESEQAVSLQITLANSGAALDCRGRKLTPATSASALNFLLTGVPSIAAGLANATTANGADLRDRLLALLVHDFRNGLASVPMGLDVLEIERGKSETVNLLRRQIDRLVRLVDEVLDVSRLLRGKIELRCEPVVLQEILQEVASNVAALLKQRNLELLLSMPAEPISLVVDPQRLIQALTELTVQRSKNIPAGNRLTLSLSKEPVEILIRLHDTGQSIDPKLLPHVFDLLGQLQHAGNESRVQLEMGLALAGGLIALHGGRISAKPLSIQPGMETMISLPLQSGS